MHIVGAPDSCKGSVPSTGVAEALERGILRVFPQAIVRKIPIADGGEGTGAAMVAAAGGEISAAWFTGPHGERLRAPWGVLGDGRTAVIEAGAERLYRIVAASRLIRPAA